MHYFSSLLSLFINLIAQQFSPQLSIVALGLCQLIGLGFVFLLPVNMSQNQILKEMKFYKRALKQNGSYLTLFILVVNTKFRTIASGC